MELKVISIKSIKKLETKRPVYDLSVAGNHNFFIGNTGTLTHNCDFLTRDGQAALRNVIEAYSATTRFILTANYIEKIIDPLISRTQIYKILPPSKKEVARKLVDILKTEGISYETQSVAQLVTAYYPDIRKIINTAQLQTHDDVLKLSVENLIGQDLKLKLVDILTSTQSFKHKIVQIRQLIADEQVEEFTELYRVLFDFVEEYAPTKVPQAVIAIAEGQFRDSHVPDKELCFVATLYNILTIH
jgi:DNA polymerase III delta prime subunit